VEEDMPCKTKVINDAQGQASPQRLSQRFVTLLMAVVSLLWLKNLSGPWYVYQLWRRAVSNKKRASVSKNFCPMFTPDFPI
jgi:hypothetical protein